MISPLAAVWLKKYSVPLPANAVEAAMGDWYSRRVLDPSAVRDWRHDAVSEMSLPALRRIARDHGLAVDDRRKRTAYVHAVGRLPVQTLVQALAELPFADLRTVTRTLHLAVAGRSKSVHADALRRHAARRTRFTQTNVLDYVVACYLQSGSFNGCPVRAVATRFRAGESATRKLVVRLVERGLTSINFGDRHPNPHVLALDPEPADQQVRKAMERPLRDACLYPAARALRRSRADHEYVDRPFTRRLALGAAQLDFESFRLEVLEIYRRDPRYHFDTNDIGGRICIADAGVDSLPASSHVFLQSFGTSVNRDLDRAVCVLLWDLHKLTPEHQQIWAAYRAAGSWRMHPAFASQVRGEWPTRGSMFDAFVAELHHINEMSARMGRPPLFRRDYRSDRPRMFSSLARPTLSEYNEFVHLLDKMMSDNVNEKFFKGEVLREEFEARNDGMTVAKPKGTIRMLGEWLGRNFRPGHGDPVGDIVGAFKKVRKERQKPAHAIEEDVFDQQYFHKQRQLMGEAYGAVRTIRLILANHPTVKGHTVEKWLYEAAIWPV
jgi:hypothetical protein